MPGEHSFCPHRMVGVFLWFIATACGTSISGRRWWYKHSAFTIPHHLLRIIATDVCHLLYIFSVRFFYILPASLDGKFVCLSRYQGLTWKDCILAKPKLRKWKSNLRVSGQFVWCQYSRLLTSVVIKGIKGIAWCGKWYRCRLQGS